MMLGDSAGTVGRDSRSTMSVMYCLGRDDGEPYCDALSRTARSIHRFWYTRKSSCKDSWNLTFSTSFLMRGLVFRNEA